MATQVCIIDGAEATRALMRMVLRDSAFHIAGEAGSLEAAMQKAALQEADMLILDGDSQNGVIAEDIPRLKALCPDLVIVVASSRRDADSVQSALQQGATGYVIKPFTAGALEDSLVRAWRRAGSRAKAVC